MEEKKLNQGGMLSTYWYENKVKQDIEHVAKARGPRFDSC